MSNKRMEKIAAEIRRIDARITQVSGRLDDFARRLSWQSDMYRRMSEMLYKTKYQLDDAKDWLSEVTSYLEGPD